MTALFNDYQTDSYDLRKFKLQLEINFEFASLFDLESQLKNKKYPEVDGAEDALKLAIELKKVVLCSAMEHRGRALF